MQEGLQPGGEALQGLGGYEKMVDSFAEQAKAFWRSLGPTGEPMVQGIEAWAQMQRAYIQWVQQSFEAGGRASQGAKRTSGVPPLLPGLTFNAWPGPGDSEGGGWDR
jgi:hypothetical protein